MRDRCPIKRNICCPRAASVQRRFSFVITLVRTYPSFSDFFLLRSHFFSFFLTCIKLAPLTISIRHGSSRFAKCAISIRGARNPRADISRNHSQVKVLCREPLFGIRSRPSRWKNVNGLIRVFRLYKEWIITHHICVHNSVRSQKG